MKTKLLLLGLFFGISVGFSHSFLLKYVINIGPIPINFIDLIFFILFFNFFISFKNIIINKKCLAFICALIFLSFISLTIGLNNNDDIHLIIRDFRYIFYFLFMILIVNSHINSMEDLKKVNNIIFIFSGIGTLQIYIYALSNTTTLKTLTSPITASIIFLSYLFILYKDKAINRLNFSILLLFGIGASLLTMVRNIWLCCLIIIIINFITMVKRNKKGLFGLLFFILCIYFIFSSDINVLLNAKIYYTFNNFYSDTLYFRVFDAKQLLNYILYNNLLLFGAGFGAVAPIYSLGISGTLQLVLSYYTENSYLFYLWKMGVASLIILIFMFIFQTINYLRVKRDITIINFRWLFIIYILILSFSGGISQVEQIFYFSLLCGLDIKKVSSKCIN